MFRDDYYFDSRILLLHGDVSEELAEQFMEGLLILAFKDPLKEIVVYIDTYGGSTYSMFAMHDMMRHINCPIHTIGVGKIMSAGVLLLAAGDRRSILPNSTVMMHQVSAGIQGKSSGMEIEISHIKDIQNKMYKLLAKYTKKSVEEIERYLLDSHDKYLTAEQAKDFGLVDEIIQSDKENLFSSISHAPSSGVIKSPFASHSNGIIYSN